MTLTELKQKRAGIVEKQRALLNAAGGSDLSGDNLINYQNLEKEFDSLTASIKREEAVAEKEAAVKAEMDARDSNYRAALDNEGNRSDAQKKAYRDAFFGRGGFLRQKGNVSSLAPNIFNVLQTGVDADGGYTVPEELESEIYKLLYNADPIRAAARVVTLGSDRVMPVQTGGATFAWIGENGSYGTTQPTLGSVRYVSHKLGGYIPVSVELLQDTQSDIVGFIRDVGVQAIADLENAAFAAGSGSNQPEGLFTVSSVAGVSISDTTGAVSATAAITGDNLIDVFHDLGRQYRARASWLMSDAAVKIIRKLKLTDNQYLWQPGLTAGQPDTILTRPVLVSDFAPTPAASTKSIVFGDLSKYMIVDRLGITMQRLNELGALNDQVYFKMSKRTDGRLMDGNALVTFTHGAAS